MIKAVFFDRDGVLNQEIYRKKLKKWSAPHNHKEVKINKSTLKTLKILKTRGFLLFVISNQPDYAIGMTSLKNLKEVHKKINKIFKSHLIIINNFYYSYKHPESLKKNHGPPCFDRKPNPYFINKAKKKYKLDLNNTWIIGDRQTDMECGLRAKIQTIGLANNRYKFNKKKKPHFIVKNISNILDIIK